MQTTAIDFQDFYLTAHVPAKCEKFALFVHGGPGSHSGYFESAIKSLPAFLDSKVGWICYDQRGCGRTEPGAAPITHAQNVADLKEIIEHLKTESNYDVDAVVGHSYGAWLSYQVFIKNCIEKTKLVLLAIGTDIGSPRNRSLMMDLIALKIHQPETFRQLYPEIASCKNEPWRLSKAIREAMVSLDLRKFFYWGNLDVMAWYEEVKQKVNLKENDTTFRVVRQTMYDHREDLKGPHIHQVPNDTLWINGFHDFLMGGESLERLEESSHRLFYGSGHYPHFEEPELFINELESFLFNPSAKPCL